VLYLSVSRNLQGLGRLAVRIDRANLILEQVFSTILIFCGHVRARRTPGGIAMNLANDLSIDASLGHLPGPPVPSRPERCLHRIADARRQQGISVRSAARRMGTSMDQVRRQEDPRCDLPLSDLYRWQEALEVPIVDLLVETNTPLSEPVLTRARLLRIMKTVRAIKESSNSVSILRFVTMLEQQLLELMPELSDVAAWHSVGQRRAPSELGRTAERIFPDSFFNDSLG
jgi:transcriptional regulator with XRE-family HTH domain